jgi:metal-responsive CopG/Arc/MetJ family transcriptional regulator
MDALTEWVDNEINRGHVGGRRRVSRSEVVAAALRAYLPEPRKRSSA